MTRREGTRRFRGPTARRTFRTSPAGTCWPLDGPFTSARGACRCRPSGRFLRGIAGGLLVQRRATLLEVRTSLRGHGHHRFVTAAYRGLLRREPDPIGLAQYVDLLASGALSRAEFLQVIAESSEAASRARVRRSRELRSPPKYGVPSPRGIRSRDQPRLSARPWWGITPAAPSRVASSGRWTSWLLPWPPPHDDSLSGLHRPIATMKSSGALPGRVIRLGRAPAVRHARS